MKCDEAASAWMTDAPVSIDVDATLEAADDRLRQHRIRHLVVLEEGDVVGVLSERDILFVRAVEGVDPSRVRVRAAMSSCTYVCAESAQLREVARAMADGRFGACVVVRDRRPVGILTTVDVCRALANALEDAAMREHPVPRVVAR